MVTVRLRGGQGNQMFEYAFAHALATRRNDTFRFDTTFLLDRTPGITTILGYIVRDYDIDVFNIEEHFTLLSRAARRLPVPLLYAGLSYLITRIKAALGAQFYFKEGSSMRVEDIPARGDIYLDGFWQKEDYFADITPIIRKEFTVKRMLSAQTRELANKIIKEDAIAVNVRRADYVSLERSIKAHGFVGLEYYQKGFATITEHVKNPRIYVFSDDIGWCKENLKFPGIPLTYVGHEYKGKKFEEYLYLMSLCKHFIIPNSTFGWWAAWFGSYPQKVVVAPKLWYADPAIKDNPALPSWIKI
jgi:hypothetical protein